MVVAFVVVALLFLGGIVCLGIGWSKDQKDGALMAQAVLVSSIVTGKNISGQPGLYNRRAARMSTMEYELETANGTFEVSSDEYERFHEGGGITLWKLPDGTYIFHRPNSALPWILIGFPWALGAILGTWMGLATPREDRVLNTLIFGGTGAFMGLSVGGALWAIFA